MDTTRFFETAIPQMVSKHFDAFLETQGSIAISVQSEGKWTLALGHADEPVRKGFDHQADLRIWFTKEAFSDFIEGKLDELDAVDHAQVVAEGNAALLESLGYLLRPNTSVLNVLMGG